MPLILLIAYCAAILAASLAGGWIPIMIRLSHRRMQAAVSLVAGVMLGVGLLHMLPHAILEAPKSLHLIFGWVLAGFLVMFFLERFFSFHRHEVPPHGHDEDADAKLLHGPLSGDLRDSQVHAHELTWGGAAIGLSLHTVIAGVALAASVQVESQGAHPVALAGFGTFLVIFLHKPFDSMTLTTLMSVGGWSRVAKHAVNAVFALMIPLGVLLFYLGLGHAEGGSPVVACALAFSAGTFLCISMSDLLPELQFHRHDRIALSSALLLGLLVAWAIGLIEDSGHQHREAPAGVEAHEPSHGKPPT